MRNQESQASHREPRRAGEARHGKSSKDKREGCTAGEAGRSDQVYHRIPKGNRGARLFWECIARLWDGRTRDGGWATRTKEP